MGPPSDALSTPAPSIDDINQLLKKLLSKELSLRENGVEISFEQPNRDWTTRLNDPTINLFLYDIRQNKLRQGRWEANMPRNGQKAILQRTALRLDLHYLITAWTVNDKPEDEHYLLTKVLLALARHPRLPDPDNLPPGLLPSGSHITKDFLPSSLQSQPGPIPVMVADPQELLNPVDIWSALDNDIRASITCTLTIALDPFQPIELDMVRGREIKVRPLDTPYFEADPASEGISKWPSAARHVFRVEGSIHNDNDKAIERLRLSFVDRGQHGQPLPIPLETVGPNEYHFKIEQLPIGDYTLKISKNNDMPIVSDIVISGEPVSLEEREGGILLKAEIVEDKTTTE